MPDAMPAMPELTKSTAQGAAEDPTIGSQGGAAPVVWGLFVALQTIAVDSKFPKLFLALDSLRLGGLAKHSQPQYTLASKAQHTSHLKESYKAWRRLKWSTYDTSIWRHNPSLQLKSMFMIPCSATQNICCINPTGQCHADCTSTSTRKVSVGGGVIERSGCH